MKITSILPVAVFGALLPLLQGCEPSTPGQLYPNTPPETRIVVAPLADSTHDHYISPEITFRVQWFGHDEDGLVTGYWLKVDGDSVWTTRGDSAIAFESPQPDPNAPGETLPVSHTISVRAVDDDGMADPTPATRTFFASNYTPVIDEFVSDFLPGSVVGAGISFSVSYSDPNPSGAFVRLWIDGVAVTDWDARAAFQFCNTSDPSILNSVDSGAVKPVDISRLPTGSHTLTLRVMDWGGAVSDSVSRLITVVDTMPPLLSALTSTYSGLDYYPDGSVFYAANAATRFEAEGSAAAYYGAIHSYRYRLIGETDSTDWTAWGGAEHSETDLAPGRYRAEVQCRDWTGAVSAPLVYAMTIIEPTFVGAATKKLLLVDETRDGNGRPGSPNDWQADSTWRVILGYDTTNWITPQGWRVSELDYVTHTVGGVAYVSPLDLFDKNVVVWHSDDKAEFNFEVGAFNRRAISEYLDRGGRLFLCGWDVGENLGNGDSLTFTASSFSGKYLRVTGGKRSNDRSFGATVGAGGYGDLHIDSAKVPNAWAGQLDKCWIFYPSHRSERIETWSGVPFDGMGSAIKNFSPLNNWRTITCGFPVYFLRDSESTPFVRKAVEELLAN